MSNYTSSKDGNFTFVLYNTNGMTTTGNSGCDVSSTNEINSYNVLKKILKEDGCTMVTLEGKFKQTKMYIWKHIYNVYAKKKTYYI